jgi:hypothetical protein
MKYSAIFQDEYSGERAREVFEGGIAHLIAGNA